MGVKVIFLGGVWKKEDEQRIIDDSIGNVQIAANVFQTNIIEGLDGNLADPVTILSEVFIGAFPRRYRRALIHSENWNHSGRENHKDYNIGFVNLPMIKHFDRYRRLKKYIEDICESNRTDTLYFIGYSMTYSIVEGLVYAKRICPNARTCLIVPDLPEYMNLGKRKSAVFYALKSLMSNKLYKDIQEIDCFVTLTRYIYDELKVNKPYTVVEGIAASALNHNDHEAKSATRDFVYTGTLAQKYGVVDLVDAFTKVKGDDLRLLICGVGDGLKHILEVGNMDHRIQYLGTLSNEEARKLQREAFVLVNPRSNKEEYTKYSFPSKTMEYMVTGKPVLMYKLKGIPDEYDDYLIYIEKDIESSIIKVLQTDQKELEALGNKARRFVLEEKNKLKQTEKILRLMDSIC